MDFTLSKEQKDIKKAASEFAKGEFKPELAHECELNHRFPRELYKKAGELGFIGMDYPEDVGGGGTGVLENVVIVEEFCKADSGLGMALHLAYIPAKIVKLFGTPEQRLKYLGPITKGVGVCGVCFTEPDHGSDLTRMETNITEEADGFVLNGTKIFTTNAAYATYFIVLAQDEREAAPGKGMTTIIVENDPSTWISGSMEINEISGKMGLRTTSSGEIVFKELKVPKKNVVGKRGDGLGCVLGFLDESRIEIAAQALGNAEGAFLKALNHARERKQFQKPIIDFQAIGHRLGRLWSQLLSVKYLTYYAAWMLDNKQMGPATLPLLTSMVKHHVPETAKHIIDETITVFGGYGYFLEQDVERRFRDNRIVEIYEGTVEVQLNNMVRILKKMNLDYIDTNLL